MTGHDAFLAAILDNPEDDAPRLLYADWLEEYGHSTSEQARAEFIRLQCALERLEAGSPQRLDFEDRASDLLMKHRDGWQQDVPEWARDTEDGLFSTNFRRGFLHRVSCKSEDFLQSAAPLLAAAPIREVSFSLIPSSNRRTLADLGWIRDGGRELAACAELAQLHHLELAFCETRIDLATLLSSPYLSSLRGLSLDFWATHPSDTFLDRERVLRDEDMVVIAGRPNLSNLKSLDLASNWIRPDGLSALIASPHLAGLERLAIGGNPIGNAGAERLTQSPWMGQLTHLGLKYTEMGDAGLCALAAGRPSRLQSLGVGDHRCTIGNSGMRALARCESLVSLRALDLARWPLNEVRVRALARSPHLAGIQRLNISDTGFDDAMARELAASPHLRGLRFLDLQNNRLGSPGLAALARSDVLNSVTDLVLYNNKGIGDYGAAALAASDHLTELRKLSLADTGLGPEGVRRIAASANLPRLNYLYLDGNPIGEEGARAICESPHFGRIRRLILSAPISTSMVQALRTRFGNALRI